MATGGSSGGNARGVRAGGAFVELGVKDRISQALRGIQTKFLAFGKLVATGGAAGAAAGGGLLAAAVPTLADLSKLDATAKAFGLTAEKASGLFGVMEASGSDIRDATEGLVTLGQRVTDAMSGTGEDAKKLFDGLGVSAANFAGLDPADQFFKLHAALREVQDPAQRVQLLLKAVGEDTGKNLIGTLSMTTEELKAQAAGFSLSGEEMAAASKATTAYNRAGAALNAVWRRIATTVAPIIEGIANGVTTLMKPFRNLEHSWDLILKGLETGWHLVWQKLPEWAEQAFFWVIDKVKQGATWIVDTLTKGLSADGPLSAVAVGWAKLTNPLVDAFDDAVYVVRNLWNDLTAWMAKAFVDVMGAVRKELGATIHKLIAVSSALPGGFVVAEGLRAVRDIGGNPDAIKKEIEAQRDAEANRLSKELDAAKEARRRALERADAAEKDKVNRLQDEFQQLLRVGAAIGQQEEKMASRSRRLQEAITAAYGMLGFGSGGFLAQAFGARSVSPQVKEQQKTNALLEQIRNVVARAPGLVWG